MLEYYEKRRSEYEAIYNKPERQGCLAQLEQKLCSLVAGKHVLEVACGTGYWTRRMATFTASLYASDASENLAVAARESCEDVDVQAGVVDAFSIPRSPEFNCLVAGFFFSHVLVQERSRFLAGVAAALCPSSRIVLFDNRFVPGGSTPISRKAESGDTYQNRSLVDGSSFEVLKNFPSTDKVASLLGELCRHVSTYENEYFWLVSGETLR